MADVPSGAARLEGLDLGGLGGADAAGVHRLALREWVADVLEHCPEQDLRWIVAEIFGFANRFVFANVASYEAMTTLPNGENAHCTVRPSEWWNAVFAKPS